MPLFFHNIFQEVKGPTYFTSCVGRLVVALTQSSPECLPCLIAFNLCLLLKVFYCRALIEQHILDTNAGKQLS
jgi:hypothetical protein